MSVHITPAMILELAHAVVIAGIIAVRYLWPLWLVIIALFLLTRGMRAVGRIFAGPTKPVPPAARPRR